MADEHGTPEPFDNLSDLFSPDDLEQMERRARAIVQRTAAGKADATTGRLDVPDAPVEGVVVEQLVDEEASGTPQLRQVIPATFRNPAVWQHRRRVAVNAAAFHSVRTPVYLGRVAKAIAVGAKVATGDAWAKLWATEYRDGLHKAKRGKINWTHYTELRAERAEVAKANRRETQTVLAATATTTYTSILLAIAQVWGLALTVPVFVPVLAWLYRVGARELAERAEDLGTIPFQVLDSAVEAERPPLTDALLNRVLRKAKVLTDEQEITLTQPIQPAEIAGTIARFKLPDEVTFAQLYAKREAIAAALDIEVHWLDLKKDGSESRVSFWYTDRNPFGEARPSPLLKRPERTDVWNTGVLIGYNRRGLPVYIKLRHVMALLGGMSRTGKGMILRNIICGLGLDPRVNIRLVAGAKPGEHRGYSSVCATFFGRRPARLLELLDALLAEAYRREAYLEDQGRAKLGEKDLDRFPLEVLIIDEAKQYLQKGKPFAEEIAAKLEELAAFAAALNITVLLSTQDPDANTIPRGFKSNSGARVATRTGGSVQTNAILKDGATGAGLRAHDIPEELKGGAIVDIDGAPGELIRGYFIEDEEYDGAAETIAAGRALRELCERAPGQFVDEIEAYLIAQTGDSSIGGGPTGAGRPGPPDVTGSASPVEVNILDLLLAAFPTDEDGKVADRVAMADVRAHLIKHDREQWGPREDEAQGAYEARVGKLLVAEIEGALDGSGATLRHRTGIRFPDGSKGSGFYREHVEAAIDAARIVRK